MPTTASAFATEEMAAPDAQAGFSSGKARLDQFFATQAHSNHLRGLGKTFVLRRPAGEQSLPALLGFYTLCMSSIPRERLASADNVGCAGVLVDAKDQDAIAFYARYGFIDLDPTAAFPRAMLIAIETVQVAATK